MEKEIDCVTPIEYDQLYAQLKQELEQGERCWFDKEEETEIQAANQAFYCTSPAEDVVKDCVTFADADTPGARFCSASALYALLKRSHGSVLRNCPPQTFSRLLTQLGHRVHTRYGNGYWVVLQGQAD
ncbi:helicase [gut metagenome]|uniref:Helicase n=1 Tax=gut metagenome TaxID=749906 RepID=J9H5S4_9ZZZZ